MPLLASLQIGLPQSFSAANFTGKPWKSAIGKTPTAAPLLAGPLGLEGDAQANRRVHGGPDKAICAYAEAHYRFWRDAYPDRDWQPGGFGENFTLRDLDETAACLGDRWEIGAAVLEISQPRQPCLTLARRWNLRELVSRVARTGYCGWYFRVVQPGAVAAGQTLRLVARPYPDWTVARTHAVWHDKRRQAERAELAKVDALADSWRGEIA